MSSTVFDLEKCMAAFGNDKEIFIAVAEEFIKQLPLEIDKIRSSVESNDADTTKIVSHTLKGIAASFYAESAKAVAFDIEVMAKENNMEGVKQKLDEFIKAFEALGKEVETNL